MNAESTRPKSWFTKLLEQKFSEKHLLLAVIAFLLITSTMQFYGDLFTNPQAPHGIISLQLAATHEQGMKVLESWKAPVDNLKAAAGTSGEQLGYAIFQTWLDYLFILVYVILGIILVNVIKGYLDPEIEAVTAAGKMTAWRKTRYLDLLQRWQRVALAAVLLAGVFDAIEDAFTLAGLYNFQHYSVTGVHIPAVIKMVLLGFVVITAAVYSIRWIGNHIGGLLLILVRFRIVTFGLLFTYAVLFILDQGQDLLLSINSHDVGPAITLLVMSILAAANWYLPKYYDEEEDQHISVYKFFFGQWDYTAKGLEETKEAQREKQVKLVARLMGAGTLLLVAVGLLHAMTIFRIPYAFNFLTPAYLFLSLMIFYYLLGQYGWLCNGKLVAGLLAAAVVIIIMITYFVDRTSPRSLAWLALVFIILSFAFIIYTNIRQFKEDDWLSSLPFYKWILTPWVIFPIVAASLVFLVANLAPRLFIFDKDLRLLCLPVVFCGIIFYELFFTVLLMIGRKKKLQLITGMFLVLVIAAIISKNDFHALRRMDADTTQVLSLDDYAKAWLKARQTEIHAYDADSSHHTSYPVFIISTYGGGIRAAAWTSKVVDAINMKLGGNVDFQRNVFAYSGASGGTIGASVQCARRYAELQQHSPHIEMQDFYKNDFLTPVLVGMLGRDSWFFILGSCVKDRGALQEIAWETHAKHAKFTLDTPFATFWDTRGVNRNLDMPLLFSNTYDINDAVKGISAPVNLKKDDFPAGLLVQQALNEDPSKGKKTMRLSTAAFTSARFPFISPTGKLNDFHHFTDGGTLENSGGETAWQVKQVFERNLRELNAGQQTIDPINIIVISIDNTEVNADSVLKAKPFFELGAPLIGVVKLGVGNTYKADYSNWLRAYKDSFEYVKIRPRYKGMDSVKFLPVEPLGWQISDAALAGMDSSLVNDENVANVVRRLKTGARIPLKIYQR